jgi:peptidoglycan hydrolase-like protein with peptidoglycan-binding domain
MKKTKSLVCVVIGLTIAFSLAVRTGGAIPFTESPAMRVRSGDISEKEAATKADVSSPSTAAKGDIFTRDLQVGSKGADVTALQNLLGVTPAIGVFGDLTKEAVINYQLSKGISPATGYVGAKTRASLNATAGKEPRP